jgi:hypothetical protein
MEEGATTRTLAVLLALAAVCAVPAAADAPRFPPGSPFTRDVSRAPLDPQSGAVIAWLQSAGGWGFGRFQVDFSIDVSEAEFDTPFVSFEPTGDHFSPDCDLDSVPVPADAALEGEQGLECTGDGDCHLIVHDRLWRRLYEMWRADFTGGVFRGGCLAVWNLDGQYPAAGRGEGCTSSDAAGLPIAPLLMDADEVAGDRVFHAGRFALPNSRIRQRTYVHPGSHATGAASGGSNAPPYGARLRLRGDYPIASLPTAGARAVARGLQRHGMFLADGGNVAFMVRSDRSTQAKWAGLLGPHDLRALQVTDFEMVDGGERVAWNGDCDRLPRPHEPACDDGVDNDDDGRVDWDGGGVGAADPQCAAASNDREAVRACGVGYELALVVPLLLALERRRRRGGRSRLG